MRRDMVALPKNVSPVRDGDEENELTTSLSTIPTSSVSAMRVSVQILTVEEI